MVIHKKLFVLAPILLLLPILGSSARLSTPTPLAVEDRAIETVPSQGSRPPLAPTPSDPPHPEIQQLQRELAGLLTSTGNRQGKWAVLAVSLDQNDTVLALNPDDPMVPASNVKLLSTAAALHHLGPDFRYRTFILGDGKREGSILNGDITLYGTGDPTLSERFFPSETAAIDSLADQLLLRGIREIRGNIVVDGSYFQGPELHPDWDPDDFNDEFAAPVSAVSLAENLVTLRVEAGDWVGAQPSIHTQPEDAGVPLTNLARTFPSGSRSRVWLFREIPTDPIGIEGEIPLGGAAVWRRLPVPDPLAFAGQQLKRALGSRGISVRGDVVSIRDPEESRISRAPGTLDSGAERSTPRILAVLESPPLLDILRIINKESHNLYAETVAKTLGRTVLGAGSFDGGAEAVARFLVDDVGVDPEEIQIKDGSGLSDQNLASTGVFIRTLEFMERSGNWELFLETLPEAGTRRELGRMYRSPAAGNLRAKTGTLDGVSALSGIVQTRSGERILFSILSNDIRSEYRAKRAEDLVGIRLASLNRPNPN